MAKQFTTIKQCEEAIHNSGGFVTEAARQLGISQPALSKRINSSERLKQAMAETRERYLDLAESRLISAIKGGESWAICFYLKCKGKERGYIERQQIDANVTGDITIAKGYPTNVQTD